MSRQSISFFKPMASLLLENLERAKTAFAINNGTFNFGLHLANDGECALIMTNMFGPQEQAFTITIDQTGSFIADLANAPYGQNNQVIHGNTTRVADVKAVLESFRAQVNANTYHYYR